MPKEPFALHKWFPRVFSNKNLAETFSLYNETKKLLIQTLHLKHKREYEEATISLQMKPRGGTVAHPFIWHMNMLHECFISTLMNVGCLHHVRELARLQANLVPNKYFQENANKMVE